MPTDDPMDMIELEPYAKGGASAGGFGFLGVEVGITVRCTECGEYSESTLRKALQLSKIIRSAVRHVREHHTEPTMVIEDVPLSDYYRTHALPGAHETTRPGDTYRTYLHSDGSTTYIDPDGSHHYVPVGGDRPGWAQRQAEQANPYERRRSDSAYGIWMQTEKPG